MQALSCPAFTKLWGSLLHKKRPPLDKKRLNLFFLCSFLCNTFFCRLLCSSLFLSSRLFCWGLLFSCAQCLSPPFFALLSVFSLRSMQAMPLWGSQCPPYLCAFWICEAVGV